MKHWLTLFVLEVRKQNGTEYPPNTLHHIVCGIMRYLRQNGMNIDFYQDPEFADFRQSLDAEMKRLQGSGLGSQKNQAAPLTEQNEEKLWQVGVLGAHNPQALLNTMIYMNGLYFALPSGDEHRQLRHNPCQIQLVECPNERSYLEYTEDISKNHQGGLKGHNQKPKVVKQFANLENPERCFVKLFKLYRQRCPVKRHDDAFYLTPLRDPKGQCWYSNTLLGHNKLRNTVANMCKQAGIQGYFTNHSLRTIAATRLYHAGIDEQLVMERTGHCNLEGIRSYKRTSKQQCETISDILNCKKICVNHNEAENTSVPLSSSSHINFNFTSCGGTINISINNEHEQ